MFESENDFAKLFFAHQLHCCFPFGGLFVYCKSVFFCFSPSQYSFVDLTESYFLSCCSFPQPFFLTPSLCLSCLSRSSFFLTPLHSVFMFLIHPHICNFICLWKSVFLPLFPLFALLPMSPRRYLRWSGGCHRGEPALEVGAGQSYWPLNLSLTLVHNADIFHCCVKSLKPQYISPVLLSTVLALNVTGCNGTGLLSRWELHENFEMTFIHELGL